MTHDREPCQLVPIWLMTIPLQHCHTGSVFMVAKLKKDRLSLTQMTYDLKPCQFIPIWLMTLHLEHCHTGNVIMVAKFFKKRQTKPNPNDQQLGTLSVGPNLAYASSLEHWQRDYGSHI